MVRGEVVVIRYSWRVYALLPCTEVTTTDAVGISGDDMGTHASALPGGRWRDYQKSCLPSLAPTVLGLFSCQPVRISELTEFFLPRLPLHWNVRRDALPSRPESLRDMTMKKLLIIILPVLSPAVAPLISWLSAAQTATLEYQCDEKPLTVKLNNPRRGRFCLR